MKNIVISKKSFFFTENFVDVYKFVCQLIDITSYIILQKEFQILKNTLLIRKYAVSNCKKRAVINHSGNILFCIRNDCIREKRLYPQ